MTGLFDPLIASQLTMLPDGHFSPAAMIAGLAIMGLVLGAATGLFGVGGGFLAVPMLNLVFGIDYSIAIGSSLCFTLGAGAGGLAGHARRKNVAFKTMWILAGGAISGAWLGRMIVSRMRDSLGDGFSSAMDGLFIALMLASAWLVIRKPAGRQTSLLQRLSLGPHINLLEADISHVSLPGICAMGLFSGLMTGLMGVGGGIILVPLMIVTLGLTPHLAVGTSLGVVLLASVSGTIAYGMAGLVSLPVAMSLLLGSTIGVQFGVGLCHRLNVQHLQRYFSLMVLAVAAALAGRLLWTLATG